MAPRAQIGRPSGAIACATPRDPAVVVAQHAVTVVSCSTSRARLGGRVDEDPVEQVRRGAYSASTPALGRIETCVDSPSA